jgi:hypothetical protein
MDRQAICECWLRMMSEFDLSGVRARQCIDDAQRTDGDSVARIKGHSGSRREIADLFWRVHRRKSVSPKRTLAVAEIG